MLSKIGCIHIAIFSSLSSGKESDVATEGMIGRAVSILSKCSSLMTFGARQPERHRLPGACWADQGHHLDLVIEEQVEGHGLLKVARKDAVDRLSRPHDRNQVPGIGKHPRKAAVTLVGLVLQDQVLIRKTSREGVEGSSSRRGARCSITRVRRSCVPRRARR